MMNHLKLSNFTQSSYLQYTREQGALTSIFKSFILNNILSLEMSVHLFELLFETKGSPNQKDSFTKLLNKTKKELIFIYSF